MLPMSALSPARTIDGSSYFQIPAYRVFQERPGVAKVDFVEVKAPSVPISTGASGIRLKFGGWEIELSSDFVPETLSEVLDVFEER